MSRPAAPMAGAFLREELFGVMSGRVSRFCQAGGSLWGCRTEGCAARRSRTGAAKSFFDKKPCFYGFPGGFGRKRLSDRPTRKEHYRNASSLVSAQEHKNPPCPLLS